MGRKLDHAKGLLNLKLVCDGATDTRRRLYEAIRSTDWLLLEYFPETQTLETIFRNLTQEK